MTTLQELEVLRQKIAKMKHDIGSAYDYLDRGRPDEEQTQMVWLRISEWKSQEQTLMQRYLKKIQTARSQDPQLLDQWATIHIGIYQDVIKELSCDADVNKTMIYIAQTTLGQWQEFCRGVLDYVDENEYLMGTRQSLIRAAFIKNKTDRLV